MTDRPPHAPGSAGPWAPPPDHPQATTVFVLGILGVVFCQVLAPFAWVMGNRALREIDAADGRLGGRGTVQAGRVCGMFGCAMLFFLAVVVLFLVVLAIVSPGSYDDEPDQGPYYSGAPVVPGRVAA